MWKKSITLYSLLFMFFLFISVAANVFFFVFVVGLDISSSGFRPLWMHVLAFSTLLIGSILSLALRELLKRDMLSPRLAIGFSTVPIWIITLLYLLFGFADLRQKIIFVVLSILILFLVYDYAIFRTKKVNSF